jgi:hypothetical protein
MKNTLGFLALLIFVLFILGFFYWTFVTGGVQGSCS